MRFWFDGGLLPGVHLTFYPGVLVTTQVGVDTLELLTERLIADGVVEHISVESVRWLLQKNISSPGRYVSGVSPR